MGSQENKKTAMPSENGDTDTSKIDIVPGDLVAVKRIWRKLDISPNQICNFGLPNEFQVIARGKLRDKSTQETYDCITLFPCCMRLKNPATGQFLCTGHNVIYFEKIEMANEDEEKAPVNRPDQYSSLEGPLGEIVGCSYYKDDGRLVFRGPGQGQVEFKGSVAKSFMEALHELGIL